MKAILLTRHGGPDALSYGDAPAPVAGPGEVVVDIHADSVNAADYKVRLGSAGSNLTFPHILGRDFSGVISAVGTGLTDLTVGDAVFAVLDQGLEGAYAETLAIQAAIIAKKPANLSHAEAAAPAPEGFKPTRADVQTLRPNVARDRKHLERMLELLKAGAVWPPDITRYPLAEAAAAQRVSESRHLRGKLVFEVRH